MGLGCSFGLRQLFQLHSTDDETESAVSLMQVVAAYIGILIAFAVHRPYRGNFHVDYSELAGLSPKFDLVDRLSAKAERCAAEGAAK